MQMLSASLAKDNLRDSKLSVLSAKRDVDKNRTLDGDGSFQKVIKDEMRSKSDTGDNKLEARDKVKDKNNSETLSEKRLKKGDSGKKQIAKSETNDSDNSKVDKTKKEKLIKKFMDSFESELQVPPTRLVEAISQLTPTELQDSAELTAESVVEKLNLDSADAFKAKQMYKGLVADLNQIEIEANENKLGEDHSDIYGLGAMAIGSGELNSKVKNTNLISANSLNATQNRFQKMKNNQMAIQQAIDSMNQSFWSPQNMNLAAQLSTGSEASTATGFSDIQGLRDLDSLVDTDSLDSAAGMGLAANSLAGLESTSDLNGIQNQSSTQFNTMGVDDESSDFDGSAVGLGALASKGIMDDQTRSPEAAQAAQNSLINKRRSFDSAQSLSANKEFFLNEVQMQQLKDNLSQNNMIKNLSQNALNNQEAMSGGFLNSQQPSLGAEMGFSKDGFSEGSLSGGSSSSGLKTKAKNATGAQADDIKSMLTAQLGISEAGSEAKSLKDNSNLNPNFGVPANADKQDNEKNIQNIMNQAQYLVKKGGGEVNVKMSPEGLGNIQLKIELINGRVQMHMVADNKETQKVLESSIKDLTDNLKHQKLAVDHIKIDSVQNVNVDVATQNQSQHQQPDSSGRDTKQFWNHFQDQFGGRSQREAIFDTPQTRGYAQKKSSVIGPVETASETVRETGLNKGKGINLVA